MAGPAAATIAHHSTIFCPASPDGQPAFVQRAPAIRMKSGSPQRTEARLSSSPTGRARPRAHRAGRLTASALPSIPRARTATGTSGSSIPTVEHRGRSPRIPAVSGGPHGLTMGNGSTTGFNSQTIATSGARVCRTVSGAADPRRENSVWVGCSTARISYIRQNPGRSWRHRSKAAVPDNSSSACSSGGSPRVREASTTRDANRAQIPLCICSIPRLASSDCLGSSRS